MGTIRVRYKHGALPGDPSSFNAHGAANGFPRVVYGGEEHDIPDDELDDKEPYKMYKNPDKSQEMVTEKEYRARLWKYGGYQGPQFNDPAPIGRNENNKSIILMPRQLDQKEMVAFLTKQEAATRKYRFFNPMCMELISDLKVDGKAQAPDTSNKTDKGPDVSKMTPKDAVNYIKTIKDENVLTALSIIEDRSPQARPAVISAIEMQLKSLRNS